MSSTPHITSLREIDLAISGMTCASCSARIERTLNKIDGVEASVNLGTERAHIRYAEGVTPEDLIAAIHHTGYTAAYVGAQPDHPGTPGTSDTPGTARGPRGHDVDPRRLKQRAIIAAVLTVPVVLLAMVPPIGEAFGGARPWVELLLSIPVVAWAAYPLHRAAAMAARHRGTTMDTLVSLGVAAAFGWSLVATLAGSTAHMYYEVAAVVTTFLLIGRYVESRARARSRSALTTLLELGAKDVAVLRERHADGGPDRGSEAQSDALPLAELQETRIPIAQLRAGERFVVRPGEKIATDGRVVDGTSAVDTSLVTGESMPIDIEPGDEVIGGTINGQGRLVVRATRIGADTTLAGITRLVEKAQTGKAPVQRLADRVSAVFVPAVLVIAALTFIGWLITGNEASSALSAAVTVLVIACPCALGLATPTALLVGTGRGAELGVLIKGPEILESTRRVDTVVLDKTGTITTGVAKLTHLLPHGKLTPTSALQAAAAVESGSEHPIAQAIVAAARERNLVIPPITAFEDLPGNGARARIRDTEVTVGRSSLFDRVPPALIGAMDRAGTTVFVGWGGTARAALTVADTLRPTSLESIRRLREMGLEPYLLTGDNEATALVVADAVDIPDDHVFAEVQPADKHALVAQLQDEGKVVAMVGDGVNDAAALARADLGIAMGSGTDVAIDSADIVLMRSQVGAVADAIGLSRRTLRTIQENLVWAFGYNILAIPLAAFGKLNPMIAGAAMALSSILVVMNSLRLRGFARPDDAEEERTEEERTEDRSPDQAGAAPDAPAATDEPDTAPADTPALIDEPTAQRSSLSR